MLNLEGIANLLEDLPDIIITGIISCTVFEILKSIFISFKNQMSEKSLPFAIGGYWGAYHERGSYAAFEFIILKHQGDKLKFKLYQKTNDDRFHFYQGIGYIRGSKVSLAYQEANRNRSNLTGTFNLMVHNTSEHCLGLVGIYTEFSKDETKCTSYSYELKELSTSMGEAILITILRKIYIKHFMDKEKYKNVCNPKV